MGRRSTPVIASKDYQKTIKSDAKKLLWPGNFTPQLFSHKRSRWNGVAPPSEAQPPSLSLQVHSAWVKVKVDVEVRVQ